LEKDDVEGVRDRESPELGGEKKCATSSVIAKLVELESS